MRLHRVGRESESPGDLGHSQFHVVPEDQAVTLADRQLPKRLDDDPLVFAGRHRLVQRRRGGVGRGSMAERNQPPAIVIAGQIEDDRPKVGRGPIAFTNSVGRAGQPDERLLDQILGSIPIVDEKPGEPDEIGGLGPIHLAHQKVEARPGDRRRGQFVG